MRAAVVERYGPPEVVRLEDVPPPAPRPDEVLVRVQAAAVTVADARIRGARFPRGFGLPARLAFGVRRPRRKVLGAGFSGQVAAVGARVTGLVVGEEVCGTTGLRMGAHAEYLTVPAKRVVPKPAVVTHENAAGVLFGGTTALYFLRDQANVREGQSVLVNGASGAVGTAAVQLAKQAGATVTGVTSTANTGLLHTLGADRVEDYARQPVTELTDRFDIVLDTVGNLTLPLGRRLLTEGGVLLLAVGTLGDALRAHGNVKAGTAPERTEDVGLLVQRVAAGELTVVLDRVVELAGIVGAHERIDSGRKVGNIVVRP